MNNDNPNMIKTIETFIENNLPVRLGVNKKNEITRLIYEIALSRDISFLEVIKLSGIERIIFEGKNGLFYKIKKNLLKIRYPSLRLEETPRLKPLKIKDLDRESKIWDFTLDPKTVFIEQEIEDLEWTRSFVDKFPDADIKGMNKKDNIAPGRLKEIKEMSPLDAYNLRRENIFLIKAKTAFIKKCPCTKNCVRCGYQILNIGFGCPVDCTYCYLQTYSNAPGLVLTANIEDYFDRIKKADETAKRRMRIGTGEFTDSLALDKYTGYSKQLIPFFKDMKYLVLELKTKIAEIENVLDEDPHENVVISWSINTRDISERYELGAADVEERIASAEKVAKKGYKVGFHFDPIVYYDIWEDEYKKIIEDMFSRDAIRKNTAWISLGTLRYTPGLKQIAERRFKDVLMFYKGEFTPDIDGKLRYSRRLRTEIYNKMVKWIRSFNDSSWIYL